MRNSIMTKATRVVAWAMSVSTAVWLAAPTPATAATVYQYEWISQSGTISADGLAHEYTNVTPGQTINLSLTLKNRSGITIKGITAPFGTVPAGKQVQVGAWGIGSQTPVQDGTPSFLDASSFVLNNNRFVYYTGADVPNGGTMTFNWTIKMATTLANGTYKLYVRPVDEYNAWTRQWKNGKTLPSYNSDIFTQFVVGSGTTTGNVNVNVASTTPAAGNVAVLATDIPMTQLNFAAGVADNAMINTIVIRRNGLSADDDVSDIKLYDGATKLGSTQGLNTTTHKATFTGLSWLIPAGTSRTLTIKATIPSTADVGKIIQLGVESAADVTLASGTATVGGTFPAYGNTFTVGAVSVGYLAVTAPTTPASATVISGSTDQDLASFKFATSSTEGFDVNSVKLTEVGTSVDSDVKNLKLEINGVQVGTTVSSLTNGTVTFTGSPLFSVPAGQTKVVYVAGDIASGITSERTVQFQVEDATHVVALGQNSHAPVTITSDTSGTAFTTLSAAGTFTIKQGTLTVAFDATNLAAQAYIIGDTQIEISKFKFSAGSREGYKVTKIKFEENGAASATDYQNVRLYIGDSTTPIATSGSVSGTTTTFEDGNGLFTVPKSGNTIVTLKLDISSSAAASDTLEFGIGNANTDYSYITAYGLDSNEKIPQDSSHITLTTCADTNASTHTIAAAGTLVVSSGPNTPVAANFSLGVTNFEIMQFRMQALSEAARVTAVTVRFFDDSAVAGDDLANLVGTGDVTNAKLFVQTGSTWTQLGSDVGSPASGVATFSFDHTVPKNTSETFKVLVDVPTSATLTYLFAGVVGTGDTGNWNIYDEVVATGVSSAHAYGTGDTTGLADSSVFTYAAPIITVLASTVPVAHSVVLNSTNVLLGKFFLKANDVENIRVSTLKLYFDQDAGNMASSSNADTDLANVHLAVEGNATLTTINKPVTNDSVDYVSFTGSDFNNQNSWIIPKGGSLIIEVRGDVVGRASATLCVGMTASDANVVGAGVSSGTSATIYDSANNAYDAIWESPELTLAANGTLTVVYATDTPAVQQVTMSYAGTTFTPTFFRAKLSAANEDIRVDALRAKLADQGSGGEDDNFAGPVYVYEGGTMVNNVLVGGTLVGSGTLQPVASADAAADIIFTTPVTVPVGGSKYLTLTADVASYTAGADSGDAPYLGIDSDYEGAGTIWNTSGNTYNNKLNIRATGASSGVAITDANDAGATSILNKNAAYVVRTKLGMAVNSASPSGTSTEQANHTIFKLSMTNTSADVDARFRAGLSKDTADATGWSAIGGDTVAADSAAYITTGAAKFSETDLDQYDGMQQDAGDTTTLPAYTRVNFWVRVSATGVAAGDLEFRADDATGLNTSVVGTVAIPALNAATWYNVDSAITLTGCQYFGVIVAVDTLTTESVTVDRVIFYNDKLGMSLSSNGGLFNTASTPITTPVAYLKDNASGSTIATGYYSGTGTSGLSTSVGRIIFIPTTEMAVPASGKVYDVVVDSSALMIVDAKNLTISVDLGSATTAGSITAGDVMWDDNGGIAVTSRATIGWVESTTNPLARSLNF